MNRNKKAGTCLSHKDPQRMAFNGMECKFAIWMSSGGSVTRMSEWWATDVCQVERGEPSDILPALVLAPSCPMPSRLVFHFPCAAAAAGVVEGASLRDGLHCPPAPECTTLHTPTWTKKSLQGSPSLKEPTNSKSMKIKRTCWRRQPHLLRVSAILSWQIYVASFLDGCQTKSSFTAVWWSKAQSHTWMSNFVSGCKVGTLKVGGSPQVDARSNIIT